MSLQRLQCGPAWARLIDKVMLPFVVVEVAVIVVVGAMDISCGRSRRNAWHSHGRTDCVREVETSYQVHTAPRAIQAASPKLEEHDVLTVGVLNDNGTLDLELLLSHGLIGVTAYAL